MNITDLSSAVSILSATTPDRTARQVSGGDFSSALAEAVSRDARQNAVALSGGMSADSAAYGGDIGAMLLATAASGGVSEEHLAMFMLLQMMQGISSGASGADAMYLSAISAALSEKLAGATSSAPRETPDAAGYDSVAPGRTGGAEYAAPYSGARAILPDAEWVPATPAIVNTAANRSPENYNAAVRQFDVTSATRYAPGRNGHTYCNIFVWDVTRALGCEIPHYIDPASGAPREYPDTAGANELNALSMGRWLASYGKRYGWTEVTPEQAQLRANLGHPAVAVSSSVSHISMVVPAGTPYNPSLGVAVAQAGSVVTNYSYLGNIYSDSGLQSVRYFAHE
ncbi:MAG: hypothetical protein LBD49_03825 [Oscillospiraceae bacterium]|jgi:hypothetical protein|nr:hypothetical protein [Oscillospiraceae bacterium]